MFTVDRSRRGLRRRGFQLAKFRAECSMEGTKGNGGARERGAGRCGPPRPPGCVPCRAPVLGTRLCPMPVPRLGEAGRPECGRLLWDNNEALSRRVGCRAPNNGPGPAPLLLPTARARCPGAPCECPGGDLGGCPVTPRKSPGEGRRRTMGTSCQAPGPRLGSGLPGVSTAWQVLLLCWARGLPGGPPSLAAGEVGGWGRPEEPALLAPVSRQRPRPSPLARPRRM